MEKILLSVSETSLLTGLSKTFIRDLLKQNELDYMLSGKKYLITNESIQAYINKAVKGAIEE